MVEELGQRIVPAATSWTGAVSSDWNAAGNWSNGLPNGNTDVTIGNTGNAPIISAAAQCGSITANAGALALTINLQGSLEITGNSGGISIWTTNMDVQGVLQVEKGTQGGTFFWQGGDITGGGTDSSGIYVCNGATWYCTQQATNLGVSVWIGKDQLKGATQTVTSILSVSTANPNAQLSGNLMLNNDANITLTTMGQMNLNQSTNSNLAGGILVDEAGSRSTIYDQGKVYHPGDTGGQTLVMMPTTLVQGGLWDEQATDGAKINFSANGTNTYSMVVNNGPGGTGRLILEDGTALTAFGGLDIESGGLLSVLPGNAGAGTESINGNVLLNGTLQIGTATGFATLNVSGNVDIENGTLTMWVDFDNMGKLVGFDKLNVNGTFSLEMNLGASATLSINTTVPNGVTIAAGQNINIVTSATTETNDPNKDFKVFNWNNGYNYKHKLIATGYQLTT